MAVQSFDRTDRIASLMQREIERVIREEVRDPRTDTLFSVTHVDVTRDLRYAKVYISVYNENESDSMLKALKKASGFIRHQVGEQVKLRYTPELLFYKDDSIAYGVRMGKLIDDLSRQEGSGHGESSENMD
ncbi:MAG: 30S ribosome-binding factor RbfA [Clostridiales bacterium]|nr:30S ribosome-binding factor RbfA [Lachnospiraceae bacterium]MCR4708246.1 30S ribosome-binding factor RbfA [Clostridiales bacterium]